jgi:hypothetical protein
MLRISTRTNYLLRAALHALIGIAIDGEGFPFSRAGICFNIHKLAWEIPNARELLGYLFEDLGLDGTYPLPLGGAYYSFNSSKLWTGAQLRLRVDLMSKLYTYLEWLEVFEEAASNLEEI